MRQGEKLVALMVFLSALSSCGTVKEKTAPCKRPANVTSFADDPRRACPRMDRINDPAAAFAAVGLADARWD